MAPAQKGHNWTWKNKSAQVSTCYFGTYHIHDQQWLVQQLSKTMLTLFYLAVKIVSKILKKAQKFEKKWIQFIDFIIYSCYSHEIIIENYYFYSFFYVSIH